MRKVILILLSGLILLSCKKESDIQTTTLDFNEFTIDIPLTWIYQAKQGYDSFVGGIKINDNEEINFDYGWYSNSFNVNNLSHLVVYRIIDGKKAKVISPNEFGSGITGVYFDSLEVNKIWKFQLSGTDLSRGNQILLLKSIETLKFKE